MINKEKLNRILCILVAMYLLIAPALIFSQLNNDYYSAGEKNYQGVIELWNIDTFEGGSSSRSGWLKKAAIQFEKKNIGTFIAVKNMTYEQLIEELVAGYLPDLISYGVGTGNVILPYLQAYKGNVTSRNDITSGGYYKGTLYGVPWVMGGYALIGNTEIINRKFENITNLNENAFSLTYKTKKNTITSFTTAGNGYNAGLLSFLKNSSNRTTMATLDSEIINNTLYNAYEKFIAGKSCVLLGTTRDVYRCDNRMANGLGDYKYSFLGGYTDLVQYMSVITTDTKAKKMAEKYIEFIISKELQNTIKNISMFSTSLTDLYTATPYSDFEKVLSNELTVLNVFTDKENIKNIISNSLLAILGDSDAQKQCEKIYN
ncbi:MAG: hypothetical protein WCX32_03790 [Clostridia bacterium]|nr:hypothetical protein [Clostridia bacterium]